MGRMRPNAVVAVMGRMIIVERVLPIAQTVEAMLATPASPVRTLSPKCPEKQMSKLLS
jgi:hypothetical protein